MSSVFSEDKMIYDNVQPEPFSLAGIFPFEISISLKRRSKIF